MMSRDVQGLRRWPWPGVSPAGKLCCISLSLISCSLSAGTKKLLKNTFLVKMMRCSNLQSSTVMGPYPSANLRNNFSFLETPFKETYGPKLLGSGPWLCLNLTKEHDVHSLSHLDWVSSLCKLTFLLYFMNWTPWLFESLKISLRTERVLWKRSAVNVKCR